MTIYQHVSDPRRTIENRTFVEPVTILGSPTYGRVIFNSHDVDVLQTTFIGTGGNQPLLTIRAVNGVSVCNCTFYGQEREP